MVEPRHSFGPFVLDAGRGLLRNGKSIAVGQRGLALLKALLDAGGGVVTKADLMERAWPGTIVEEGNLTVQIAALRKSLGTTHDGQDWIATVPRLGYRLVRPGSGSREADASVPALAVLPFANLGSDPGQDWFADGVVEDIITALSRFQSFAVVARNSSFVYKGRPVDVRQVAQDLGVRYVLEGGVRRAGERLRITAQLVDGSTGAHLWAEQFDGMTADVFDFQDRITERVAMEVEPHIHQAELARSRLERPGSIAAYDIYLQALPKISNRTASANAEAYALLTGGLALEPDNALLLSHAAWTLNHRRAMGWPPFGPDDMQKSVELARRGLQHAGGNPTVMAHCGMVLLHRGSDYDWGMAVLQSAAEANPNSLVVVTAAGIAHLHCGSVADALTLFQRALRLSPRDPFAFVPLTGIAHAQMILGDYSEALAWATRSLALNPTFDPTLWMLIAANAHLARMEEARHFLDELGRLALGVTVARIRAGQPAKDPSRMSAILDGLRLAGLAAG
jgi:TolB-like protein